MAFNCIQSLPLKKAFYVFGGTVGEEDYITKVVSRFDEQTRKWSLLGEMISARNSHSAIFDGKSFLVIGGKTGKGLLSIETTNSYIQ